jgi:3-isopropylmalate/(R)-2-methylmalate dehydratase small subunit
MEPVRQIRGGVSLLDRNDVDTDQIVPKQFLKALGRTGFADALFYDWAKQPGWDLPRNPILATGRNFGYGSSREHAVWALQEYGFKAIVATSFADIFYSNCTKVGLLPVVLVSQDVRALAEAGEGEVDLECQVVRFAGREVSFDIDAEIRRKLLEGLDDISVTLADVSAIERYEGERERSGPVTTKLVTTDLE